MESSFIKFLSKLLDDEMHKIIIEMIYEGKSYEEIIEKLIDYKNSDSND